LEGNQPFTEKGTEKRILKQRQGTKDQLEGEKRMGVHRKKGRGTKKNKAKRDWASKTRGLAEKGPIVGENALEFARRPKGRPEIPSRGKKTMGC